MTIADSGPATAHVSATFQGADGQNRLTAQPSMIDAGCVNLMIMTEGPNGTAVTIELSRHDTVTLASVLDRIHYTNLARKPAMAKRLRVLECRKCRQRGIPETFKAEHAKVCPGYPSQDDPRRADCEVCGTPNAKCIGRIRRGGASAEPCCTECADTDTHPLPPLIP